MTVREISAPDKTLAWGLLALVLTGLTVLASASHTAGEGLFTSLLNRQLGWIGIGCVAALIIWVLPMRLLERGIIPFYTLSVLLLLLVLFIGRGPAGRWLVFLGVRFQPAELAKAATLLMLVRWLSRDQCFAFQFSGMAGAFFWVAVPGALVAVEPDLGTSLVFVVIGVAVLFWRGLPGRWMLWPAWGLVSGAAGFQHILFLSFLMVTLTGAVVQKTRRRFWGVAFFVSLCCGLLGQAAWQRLPVYQKLRVESFLSSDVDPHGSSYQVIQSKIAIGSGKMMGKGFGRGTQTQLKFLPEHHTDFIFSAMGESFGLGGVTFILMLWGGVLWRVVRLAERRDSLSERLMLFGLAALWGFQVIVNIAMTVGWAPVTGLPLPFFSYGGSAMVINMALSVYALKCTVR